MNCINCGKDLSKYLILDFRREIICDDCTFWAVVSEGKKMGIEMPSERSKCHLERLNKPTKVARCKRIPLGERKDLTIHKKYGIIKQNKE